MIGLMLHRPQGRRRSCKLCIPEAFQAKEPSDACGSKEQKIALHLCSRSRGGGQINQGIVPLSSQQLQETEGLEEASQFVGITAACRVSFDSINNTAASK